MASFTVRAPTGESYDVTAPDGATQDQVMAYVQAHHASMNPTPAPSAPQKPGFMRQLGDAAMTVQRAIPGVSEFSALVDSRLRGAADELTGRLRLDPADPYGSLHRQERAYYDASRARQQGMVDELKAAHPVLSNLATGVGFAAQAVPAIASGGATVAPELASGAAETQAGVRAALSRFGKRTLAAAPKNATTGAAYGAANAAGQPGSVADRLHAANAAVIPGALAGVAVPGAIDLASGAARHTMGPALNRALTPFVDPGSAGFTTPELRAAQAVKNAIARDEAAGHVIDPSKPLRHAGGENVAALYDVVAQSPGPGRQLLRDAVNNSRAATYANVESDLGANLGGRGDYFATLDKVMRDRAANAREGIARLGDHLVTLDENSISALRSDLAQGALRNASANGLASPDPEIRAGAANLNRLSSLALDKPSAQTMTVREAQDISEALLSAADSAYKNGDGARGKALKGLGKAIRENARTPDRGGFSEYDDWLKQYASDSDNKRALELGSKAMTGGIDNSPEAVGRELADMGAGALDFYRKGVGEALLHKVRGAGGDIKVMRDLLRDRNLAARVRLAFPDDASFANFIKAADERVNAADRDNRFMGGSPTYARQAARADLEDAGTHPLDVAADVASFNGPALAGRAARKALKMLPRGTPKSAIMDPTANAALGRSATDPDEVTRLLNMIRMSRRIASAPTIQGRLAAPAGNVAAMQAGAAIGRH